MSDESIPSNWIKCQSKSRAGKCYYFNKATGETSWVPPEVAPKENLNKKLKISPTGSVLKQCKTPAQDRLKRLQSNLPKLSRLEQTTKKTKFTNVKCGKLNTKNKEITAPQLGRETANIKDTAISIPDTEKNVKLKEEIKSTHQTVQDPIPTANSTMESTGTKFENSYQSSSDIIKTCTNVVETPESVQTTTIASNSESSLFSKFTNICKEFKKFVGKKRKVSKEDNMDGVVEKLKRTNSDKTVSYNETISKTTQNEDFKKRSATENEYIGSICVPIKSANKTISVDENISGIDVNTNLTTFPNFIEPIQLNTNVMPLPKKASSQISLNSSVKNLANDRLQRLRSSLDAQKSISTEFNNNSFNSSINSINSNELNFTSNSTNISGLSSEYEEMEWEAIEDDIKDNIDVIRNEKVDTTETCSEYYDTVKDNLFKMSAETDAAENDRKYSPHCFYFVVDTNVFLINLSFLGDLCNMKLPNNSFVNLVVPYCVLQELDKLKIKSTESVKTRATRAIRFLNSQFSKKDSNVIGESVVEADQHIVQIQCADDSILNCCLQLRKKVNKVILISNDINLRNKAIVNQIQVTTKDDLVKKEFAVL